MYLIIYIIARGYDIYLKTIINMNYITERLMIISYTSTPIIYKYDVYFPLLYSIATHSSLTIQFHIDTFDTFSSYGPIRLSITFVLSSSTLQDEHYYT